MTTWYAAPASPADVDNTGGIYANGNDANSGLSSAAPKTIYGAEQAAAPGDEIVYIPGRYRANRTYTTPATQWTGTTVSVADGAGQFALSSGKAGLTHRPLVDPVAAPSFYSSGNAASSLWRQTVQIELMRLTAAGQTVRGLRFVSPYWPNTTGRWKDTPLRDTYRLQNGFIGLLGVVDKNATIDQCEFFGGYGGALNPTTYPHGYGGTFTPFDLTDAANTQHCVYNEVRSTPFWRVKGGAAGLDWASDDNCEMWEACISGDTGARSGWGNSACGVDPAGLAAAVTANSGYNPFFVCPTGIVAYNGAGASCAGLTVKRSHFDSLRSGINAGYQYSTEAMVIDQNFFEHIFMDCLFLAGVENIFTTPESWTITRNVLEKPWGEAKDAGNAHGDIMQLLLGNTHTGKHYMDRIRILRNFWSSRAGKRGFAQGGFIGSNSAHQNNNDVTFCRLPMVAENVGILDTQIGMQLTLQINSYAHGNIFVSEPDLQSVDPAPAIFFEGMSAVRNPALAAEPSGLSFGSKNITDGGYLSSPDGVLADFVAVGGRVLGKVGSGTPYSAIFKGTNGAGAGFGAGWSVTDFNQIFDAYQVRDVAANGGINTTLESFIESAIPWASYPLWIGWAPKKGIATGTLTAFEGAQVAGGGAPGSTCTVTPQAGVEVKVTNIDETVIVQDWTTAAVTNVIRNSHRVQIRYTSGALASQTTNKGVTIDGQTFTARITTASNNAFPRATFDGSTNWMRMASASGGLGADSETGCMVILGTPLGAFADTRLYDFNGGSTGKGLVNFSASNLWNFNFRNSAATSVISSGAISGAATAGTITGIAVAFDLSKSAIGDGLKTFKLSMSGGAIVWTPAALAGPSWYGGAGHQVNYSKHTASAFHNFFRNSAGTKLLNWEHQFWWETNQYVDLTDPNVQAKFTADMIGADGDGIIAGVEPLIFLPGKASLLNANTNLGTAPLVMSHGGTIAAGTPDVWPVPLTIVSEVLTTGPYTVGQPIDILVYPIGANVPKTITASVAGGTGAWEQNPMAMGEVSNGIVFRYTPSSVGTHSIDFADNSGTANPDYANPTTISITALAPPAILPSPRRKRMLQGMYRRKYLAK